VEIPIHGGLFGELANRPDASSWQRPDGGMVKVSPFFGDGHFISELIPVVHKCRFYQSFPPSNL
jgi:hypothetical protein